MKAAEHQESSFELSEKQRIKKADAMVSDAGSEAVKEAVTHEELIKKMEGLKFRIEPDVICVDACEESTNVHEIINENTFPIIFRVKVTHPYDFRVNPTNGIVGAKRSLMLKVKRLRCAPRSDRFDIEALPYDEELFISEKRTPHVPLQHRVQWFFSLGYIPIVYSIRYKQIMPWDAIFPALDDPNILKISPQLSQICEETGITTGPREYLTLNEFIILDAATTTK